MPDAQTLHQRRAADAGRVAQLVDDNGVGDKALAAGDVLGNLIGDEATQIAGVAVLAGAHVVHHLIVDAIHATGDGLEQATAAHHCSKVKRATGLLDGLKHELLAPLILVGDGLELGNLLNGMRQALVEELLLVLKNGNLGRCRTRIYN